MSRLYVWPVGFVKLVKDVKEIPTPNEYMGSCNGYRFYKTDKGKYAIEE
jgi:hypothetical protein